MTAADLLRRYRASLPSFVSPYYAEPISIDRGEGGVVWDLDGHRYLDWFGGVLTTMIGHAHPKVTAAVQEQAAKVMHTSTLYLSEPMIELAEKICELSGIPDARVFLTPSGTEANDAAHACSPRVIANRTRSWRCATATTGARSRRRRSPSTRSWSSTSPLGHCRSPSCRARLPTAQPVHATSTTRPTPACVDDLNQTCSTMATSAGTVACLIAEPIQGVGGFRDAARRLLRGL